MMRGKMNKDEEQLAVILHDVINEIIAGDVDTNKNLSHLQNMLKNMIEGKNE